jgi:aldehyde:ferredoxin oxidoreductase
MNPYHQRLGFIDLGRRVVDTVAPPRSILTSFLGGRGLGAAILYRHGLASEPLSDESLCCLLVGPLTGTEMPLANRLSFVFRSPATRTLACANTGGYVAVALKNAGFDGLMLRGRSERPSYLFVQAGRIEIRDASDLWGRGAIETTSRLVQAHPHARVLAIGPAGELLSPMATVINDKGRASGVRHGIGAVLGSKLVKAIVIADAQHVVFRPADEVRFRKLRARLHAALRESPVLNPKTGTMSVHGTAIAVEALGRTESLPVRNYRYTTIDGYEKVGGLAMTRQVLVDRLTCSHCPVRCRRETAGTSKREFRVEGPDYAQLAALGTNCGLTDVEAVAYLNYLCYELGLDPIEMGNTLAMLAEATERGQVRRGLDWGDADRMAELTQDTAFGRAIGATLSRGATEAAARLDAPELAMSVKGISIQNCDPRPEPAWGLLNATETAGSAAHIWSYGDLVEGLAEVGVRPIVRRDDPPEDIAASVKYKQDLVAVLDAMTMCAFSAYAFRDDDYAEALGLFMEEDIGAADLLRKGASIIELERRFNEACGFGASDDTLPRRFLEEPVPTGIHAGRGLDLGPMMDAYYALRGWSTPNAKRGSIAIGAVL